MDDPRDDWYEGFQRGLMARFWHLASDPSGDEEADAIASLLELPAGARILDAPCGAGRISIRLAERGFDVTGIDISEHEVKEARSRAASRGVKVRFELADIRRPPPGPFDAVVIWGNSFGYMPHPDTLEHIGACRRVLGEGGRLILETGTAAEVLLPGLRERMDYDMGEVVMSGVNSYDPGRGRLVTEIELRTPDGRVERGAVAHHVFTAAEIVRMVESSKFRVSELLGDPVERSAFGVGSRRLILLATAV